MDTTCPKCSKEYDDADCSTLCPHPLIMPKQDLDRKKLAFTLAEKPLRFRHMPETSAPLFIESIGWNGMVTIRGMVGEFAPHLFAIQKSAKPTLMERLAEIMPKVKKGDYFCIPEKITDCLRIETHPVRQSADAFTGWLEGQLPANEKELRAVLWTFGEILCGQMEKQLNEAIHRNADLLSTLTFPIISPEGR